MIPWGGGIKEKKQIVTWFFFFFVIAVKLEKINDYLVHTFFFKGLFDDTVSALCLFIKALNIRQI